MPESLSIEVLVAIAIMTLVIMTVASYVARGILAHRREAPALTAARTRMREKLDSSLAEFSRLIPELKRVMVAEGNTVPSEAFQMVDQITNWHEINRFLLPADKAVRVGEAIQLLNVYALEIRRQQAQQEADSEGDRFAEERRLIMPVYRRNFDSCVEELERSVRF